jgi:hypothetical protein
MIKSPRAGQNVKTFWLEIERVLFQASGVAGNVFWSAVVSTNPNCCDTSVILSQLETSRPRSTERAAFIAFGNLRSVTR